MLRPGDSVVLLRQNLGELFVLLRADGFRIVGPTVRDGAIVPDGPAGHDGGQAPPADLAMVSVEDAAIANPHDLATTPAKDASEGAHEDLAVSPIVDLAVSPIVDLAAPP